ncbi:MAG TPA: acyl-CoA thioesterase [Candidatus Micrarchaeota archaeon]|nr:acyl-CoA thioesterase [Candidatus Micrarchaeota archaeon]
MAQDKTISQMTDIVMPHMANHYGTMFGGTLVAMMDKAAYLAATRHTGLDCVTVHIDNINFSKPAKIGDVVIAEAHVVETGSTSIKIAVSVKSERFGKSETLIDKAVFVFVAVDKNGKPTVIPEK